MVRNDVLIISDGYKFNFRVALLIKNKDRILLESIKDFWNMPGGRIKFGESTLQATQREAIEEFGIELKNLKLFHVAENFFSWMGNYQQELLFVYGCELADEHELILKDSFECKDSKEKMFKWFDKGTILKREIKCLPNLIYELVDSNTTIINHSIDKAD